MKKIVVFSLVCLLIPALSDAGNCGDAGQKLARGVSNLLTCPAELPYRMKETYERDGLYEAMTYGFFDGMSNVIIRAAVGFCEASTFLIPIPQQDYEPILTDPEYFIGKPSGK